MLCPAHGLNRARLRKEVKQALLAGRMAIVSPFCGTMRRCTRNLAAVRNRFVAALSSVVIVPHAAPGSSTERLARDLIEAGMVVLTVDDPSNNNLFTIGAQRLEWSTLQPGFRFPRSDKSGANRALRQL